MAFDMTVLALLLEALFALPKTVSRRIGDAAGWIGAIALAFARVFDPPTAARGWKLAMGAASLVLVLLIIAIPVLAFEIVIDQHPHRVLLAGLVGALLFAQRRIYGEAAEVARALESGTLEDAHAALGEPGEDFDGDGIARQAIARLADGFCDRVVGPAVWMSGVGLTGATLYVAVNAFARATRRYHGTFSEPASGLNDLLTMPPSRLCGGLLLLAAAITPGASARGGAAALRQAAARDVNPNAGWAQAPLAGALGLNADLASADVPRPATAADIRAALRLFCVADALLILIAAAGFGLIHLLHP